MDVQLVLASRPVPATLLEALFPSLAADFDVEKNGFEPSEITAGSQKKVWWRNAQRGSWQQAPDVRTDRRRDFY